MKKYIILLALREGTLDALYEAAAVKASEAASLYNTDETSTFIHLARLLN